MTTGSLCFTEILKSWKSCSSNSEASQTADSTSASGVALPYFSSSRGSSEPALTPIRIETPASLAAWAIASTWSSNLRMLPGLTRTAAQPASMAAKTYLGWKWMSAITGICDFLAIAGSASASSWDGQATRTMSQPVAVSSAICCSVALMSVVGVVVIDWTLTGASPPTSTLPTLILRVVRRGASTGGGAAGMPSEIGMDAMRPVSRQSPRGTACRPPRPEPASEGSAAPPPKPRAAASAAQGDRAGRCRRRAAARDIAISADRHPVDHRQRLGDVDRSGVGAAAQPGDLAAQRPPTARRRRGRRPAGAAGRRLKTNSAMFSDPRIPRMLAAFSWVSMSSSAAISPASRPTPTTPIGPSGSRSSVPKAACATSTIRAGSAHDQPRGRDGGVADERRARP